MNRNGCAVERFVPLVQWNGPLWGKVLAAFLGTIVLAGAGRVDLPMVPVPMSLQTYVVLLIAALFGPRWGALTIALYLLEAAVGLPVLAGGAQGVSRILGPTGGYLFGFLVSAIVIGRLAEAGWTAAGFLRSFGSMLLAHAIILALGVTRLSLMEDYGLVRAVSDGATPFLLGVIAKSALASWTVLALRRAMPSSE